MQQITMLHKNWCQFNEVPYPIFCQWHFDYLISYYLLISTSDVEMMLNELISYIILDLCSTLNVIFVKIVLIIVLYHWMQIIKFHP